MRRGEEEGSPSSSKGSASLTQPMSDSVQIIRDHQVGTSKLCMYYIVILRKVFPVLKVSPLFSDY